MLCVQSTQTPLEDTWPKPKAAQGWDGPNPREELDEWRNHNWILKPVIVSHKTCRLEDIAISIQGLNSR